MSLRNYVKSAQVSPNISGPDMTMGGSAANRAGHWFRDSVLGNAISPFYNATKDSTINWNGQDYNLPWWVNSGITGGLAGGLTGGVINKMRGGGFMKGFGWGGLLGAGGLLALGGMSRDPNWAENIPFIGPMLRTPDYLRTEKFNPNVGATLTDEDPTSAYQTPANMMWPMNRGIAPDLRPDRGSTKIANVKMASLGIRKMAAIDPQVIFKIYNDTSLSISQKQELATKVKYLDAASQRRLSKLISGMVGGGVGFIIAKFLLGMGGFSTALTTIAAGLGSAHLSGGRPPKPPTDTWGNPYYM